MKSRERIHKLEKKINFRRPALKIFYKVPGDVLSQVYIDRETGERLTRTQIYQRYAGKIQFALLDEQDRDL